MLAETADTLKVYLLGRFEVVRGDAPVPGHAWRRRRPADLLKLVALAPGRALPRERVVEALWPGRDHASGANNLHRALYDLRQILGGRWVDLDRGQVRLRTGAWVDVEAFETAAGAGDPAALELAAALYRGPLAPEDLHAAWLAERRAELRRRFAAVALSAAGSLAGRGEAGKAIPLLRRAADADPLSEPVHHLLARLLAEAGRRAEALRQVEVAEEALRAAGREPGEPLRALRAAIQRGEVGPTPGGAGYDGARRVAMRLLGTADPPPLRGRPAALGLIEALAGRGCGGLVLLGEPGVGKTRLAVEGARLAQSRGAVVLAGTTAGADGRPYGPFADAFADYYRAGGTAGSDPFAEGPAAGGVEGEKLRLFEAVRGALRAVGGGKPVYLLLDEVDEVDESSANLVHYLLRGAEALPLAVVATCREESVRAGEPVRTLLAHLDAEKLARGARLQRLDLGATREQLADLLGVEPPAPLAAQFHRVADGNPYRAEELARAWREGGRLPTGDLAAAIRERAGRLGPEAGALLAAGAVAGRRFDLAVAATAADLPEEASRAAAERCLEAQLLDEDDGALRFHHALAREALLQAIPAPRRAALHRSLADALEARAAAAPGGLDAGARIAHHRRGGDQPERAARLLVAQGHRAAARAGLREALDCYEQALPLADAAGLLGPERLELLEATAQVQLADAELPGLLRTAEAAVALAGPGAWRPAPEQRARVRRLAALGLLAAGRIPEARAQLDAGLAEAAAGPGEERPELLHLLSQVEWHEGRYREALVAAERCAAEAGSAGDAPLAQRGLDMEALARASQGELAAVAERSEPAEAGPDEPFEVHLLLFQRDLLGDRRLAELEVLAALLGERAAARGARNVRALALAVGGALSMQAGRLARAEASLREAARLHREARSALGEGFALERLGLLLSARGLHGEAAAALADAVVAAERAALRRHALLRAHAALAAVRLRAGADGDAEHALHEVAHLSARHGHCVPCEALHRPAASLLALRRGRILEAEAEASRLDAAAARHGGLGLLAEARRTRGRVLLAQGRCAEARAAFADAARDLEALGADLPAASTRALEAGALRAAGEHREAEPIAAGAARRLAEMGADLYVE